VIICPVANPFPVVTPRLPEHPLNDASDSLPITLHVLTRPLHIAMTSIDSGLLQERRRPLGQQDIPNSEKAVDAHKSKRRKLEKSG